MDDLLQRSWAGDGWTVERQALHLTGVVAADDVEAWRPGPLPRRRFEVLDGLNLVAELPGEGRDAIAIVAHHDTVNGSPGADDNGSGVVALLELARLLAGRRFRHTVVLAAPDFEEIGLIGSAELVPWLMARYSLRGVIVFDAIGYADPAPGTQAVPPGLDWIYPGQLRRLRSRGNAGDAVLGIYRGSSTWLMREWARCLAATLGRDRILLLRDPLDLPLVGRLAARLPAARNFSRSDHVPFWRAGIPAIFATDSGNFRNPNYHRPSDLPATLDYETLAGIIAATAVAVERLASG
ncbi:MAG TPA: M28 family peptidase [Candidatus Eisenbacteria bacterium]|nr:M28 family peptidase [Candidatus Eisenbacteria bacterium]